ncbi:Defects in Rab1 recruitment protein A [Legionella massiliensis]|uniref:Defects in Rab1 recruitment protein A n=1 Tax=Legionella massiliensis TaxID=1034943 RepID=A0A078L153_9GAMM|nr:hypothetical protein [Legionella massiliensis]CDZ77798.1 Defects in Rab1 recruitment protein A [Legionella massiliensis]CEE13536.1 Multifunctional virulence effector protein DrrA [Legionella massiliensis]
MHFIDNMQDSKRNLEQIQGRLGKRIKRREPEEGSLKALIEEMEDLNKKSLGAQFAPENPKQFIKFLDAKIALLDAITDSLTELYKIKSDAKFQDKLHKYQVRLDNCLDSAWRQLVQISQIESTTTVLPELNLTKPEIRDYINMRGAITAWVSNFDAANFLKKSADNQPKTVKIVTTPLEPILTVDDNPEVAKAAAISIAKVETTKTALNTIHNNYAYPAKTNKDSRWYHAFKATTKDTSQAFKDKHKDQIGDHLKNSILEDFRKQIEDAPFDLPEFKTFVTTLRNTEGYAILKTGQGCLTTFFDWETSSVAAFNEMVAEKIKQIGQIEQQAQLSISNS